MTALLPQNLEFPPVSVGVWPVRQFSLVSLWDMQQLLADIFYFAAHQLDEWHCEIRREIEQRGSQSNLTAEEIKTARTKLDILKNQCVNVHLNGTLKRLSDIEILFIMAEHDENEQVSLERITFQLEELNKAIVRDLKPLLVLTVESDDADKYEQKEMFGSKVYANFESTRYDVTEAGNCFALGRYTACVFHCMRALEAGLRSFVRELNTKHNAGIDLKKTVDGKSWGVILIATQKRLDQNQQNQLPPLDPKPTKAERRFYSKAIREFGYFKDAWRNDVAHNNVEYDKLESKRVMDHVGAFMNEISRYGLTEQ